MPKIGQTTASHLTGTLTIETKENDIWICSYCLNEVEDGKHCNNKVCKSKRAERRRLHAYFNKVEVAAKKFYRLAREGKV